MIASTSTTPKILQLAARSTAWVIHDKFQRSSNVVWKGCCPVGSGLSCQCSSRCCSYFCSSCSVKNVFLAVFIPVAFLHLMISNVYDMSMSFLLVVL